MLKQPRNIYYKDRYNQGRTLIFNFFIIMIMNSVDLYGISVCQLVPDMVPG